MNFHLPLLQKRVCAIHDLSGFGRASLTLVIPILASLGIQVCPLPTAVLSSQTSGMQGFSFLDLTASMYDFLAHWKELGLRFDCVYSGFLGNPQQIEIAQVCIDELLNKNGFAFVDPVLGDNGVLDPTQTKEMVDAQRNLVRRADIIAPNLTEAAFLLNEPYCETIPLHALKDQLIALADFGPAYVIITSAPASNDSLCSVVAYEKESKRFWRVENKRYPVFYPGTGDTFSSVIVGELLSGASIPLALSRAVSFVSYGIALTYGYGTPPTDGVLLEQTLFLLREDHCPVHYEEI
ncbi:MAG: pyridoxamine kinase [Desulfovibrionaceae bacterium]|nr:pyridoxamine kinase [Desulfovibrionaceae bacterium]